LLFFAGTSGAAAGANAATSPAAKPVETGATQKTIRASLNMWQQHLDPFINFGKTQKNSASQSNCPNSKSEGASAAAAALDSITKTAFTTEREDVDKETKVKALLATFGKKKKPVAKVKASTGGGAEPSSSSAAGAGSSADKGAVPKSKTEVNAGASSSADDVPLSGYISSDMERAAAALNSLTLSALLTEVSDNERQNSQEFPLKNLPGMTEF
jgi:hypothetical protein